MQILLLNKKLEKSESYNDNLLLKTDNIYVMDNHRLAMWCWLQSLDFKTKYNFLHIDAHPDLADFPIEKRIANLSNNINLEEFRNTHDQEFNIPLFRWDNYINAFDLHFKGVLDENYSFSCTHYQGSRKALKNELFSNQLPGFVNEIFSEKRFLNDKKWVVNIDLDFFFSSAPQKIQMFSADYIDFIFKGIKLGLDKKLIQVLTIALSPECAGSWDNSFQLLKIIQNYFNVDFLSELDN